MAIPPEHDPFFKWDPDGTSASARAATRAAIHRGRVAPDPGTREKRRRAAKRWLLRWAWLLSTGVLVFGYLVLVALLSGHASWLGV